MVTAVLTQAARPFLEHRIPKGVEPLWFDTPEQLLDLAPSAEIGWFDLFGSDAMGHAIRRAANLRWLSTVAAGVNHLPLDILAERGVQFTNGAGLNSDAIAEYVVLGMLTMAKGYRDVVRAQDRAEWLHVPPGVGELSGSSALIIGAGGIGNRVSHLLQAFGVTVTAVRRTPSAGTLQPNEWRAQLGRFDWVIIAVPVTPDTLGMMGNAEFAAVKPGATILNVARGEVIVTDALLAAIDSGHLGGAFLDVTDPEPLPPEHPLWSRDNVHISMHLSGRSQNSIMRNGADRFLANLDRFLDGLPLHHSVDLRVGY